jgi:2-keto-4-pentenoate hydratase/2-oxohepta-3-ene-1,7-dioic acid hydratase in catechol pathway
MRLVSYGDGGALRAGVLIDDRVVDAAACAAHAQLDGGVDWSSAREIIAQDSDAIWQTLVDTARARAASGRPRTEFTLGPPIPDPEKILCIGLNYRDHVDEAASIDEAAAKIVDPVVFSKFNSALIGDRADVVLPTAAPDHIDWEGELAVVIGRRARHVAAADALDHVAGYTILNDVSARDVQLASPQWLMGKSFDTSAPCGPALVTRDEVADPQSLQLETKVNGAVMQSTSTSLMINPIARLIEHISALITLVPGDVIATGTPAGVGFARTPPVFLRDGDVVEVTISGLGTLTNAVRAGSRD